MILDYLLKTARSLAMGEINPQGPGRQVTPAVWRALCVSRARIKTRVALTERNHKRLDTRLAELT